MRNFDLEARIIQFAITVMQLCEKLPNTKAANQLGGQLINSSSSCPLNYGEAQSAESRKDFIHKMKIVLKELRESNANLKMIDGLKLAPDPDEVKTLLKEANELISIFVKSIQTATGNDAAARQIEVKRRIIR